MRTDAPGLPPSSPTLATHLHNYHRSRPVCLPADE
ncbi:hypothetical protein CGCTS75_v009644 [Colletotrichum tropicale]|nr:hypothetical protein CGCTS75_v009644 [Colletotrichum tropicale]